MTESNRGGEEAPRALREAGDGRIALLLEVSQRLMAERDPAA
jgi:hypothetical protein